MLQYTAVQKTGSHEKISFVNVMLQYTAVQKTGSHEKISSVNVMLQYTAVQKTGSREKISSVNVVLQYTAVQKTESRDVVVHDPIIKLTTRKLKKNNTEFILLETVPFLYGSFLLSLVPFDLAVLNEIMKRKFKQ